MSLVQGRTLVVLDTETTGFDPTQGHELIEVAALTVVEGVARSEWSSLIRTQRPIPPDASAVHGITGAMIATAPPPAEVAAGLREACADHLLVLHNAWFDLPFLRALLRGAGQRPLLAPVLDTLGLSRGLFGAGGNSLDQLIRRLELPTEPPHRALGDARTAARVLLALAPRWERERGIRSLEELAAASLDLLRVARRARAAPKVATPALEPELSLFPAGAGVAPG